MTKAVIRKTTLKSQVYEHLKEEILLGHIKPGARLVEEKIAEELQVSRSPIREAIQMLEQDGLLHVKEGGGVTVVQPSVEDFQSLYECRVEMESLAAYYAAARRSGEELEEIRIHLLTTTKVVPDKDLEDTFDANARFHEAIIAASGNSFLVSMTAQLRGVNRFYRKAILAYDQSRMADASAEHESIFQAIANQDREQARKQMRQHIESDFKLFMRAVKARQEAE